MSTKRWPKIQVQNLNMIAYSENQFQKFIIVRIFISVNLIFITKGNGLHSFTLLFRFNIRIN